MNQHLGRVINEHFNTHDFLEYLTDIALGIGFDQSRTQHPDPSLVTNGCHALGELLAPALEALGAEHDEIKDKIKRLEAEISLLPDAKNGELTEVINEK